MDSGGSLNGLGVREVQAAFVLSFPFPPLNIYSGKVGTLSARAGGLF